MDDLPWVSWTGGLWSRAQTWAVQEAGRPAPYVVLRANDTGCTTVSQAHLLSSGQQSRAFTNSSVRWALLCCRKPFNSYRKNSVLQNVLLKPFFVYFNIKLKIRGLFEMLVLIACCGSSLAVIVQENAEGKSATNLGIGKVLRLLPVSWQNDCC